MSKRAHQVEQPDSSDEDMQPEPGGGQQGEQAGEHPQIIIHPPNQAFEDAAAGAGAGIAAPIGAGAPGAAAHPEQQQELINIDNILITDDVNDSPEVKALKNYSRQIQAEAKDLHQSVINQGRLLDNKKVDNARLLREKQKLTHEMDALSKQMEKLKASSEAEIKQVVQPDKNFTEDMLRVKHANPMERASKLILDHYEQQEKIKKSYGKPLIDLDPYERLARRDSDDETPRTRQSTHGLHSSESSIDQAFEASNERQQYPHPKRLQKCDSVEDLTTQTTYDVDDWKRVQMKTPQQDQLDSREQIIKAEDKAISQQNLFIKILEKIQPQQQASGQPNLQSVELDSLIHLAKQTITSQKAHLEKLSKEVKKTKQVATYYSHSLAKPTLYEFVDYNIKGTREALQAKNIKYVVDSFDPDKNPDQDFGAVWRKILMHTNNLRLDEAAYKDILTIVVQGSAAHVLFELIMEEKPLHQILQTFSDLYTKSKTIIDHMNDLNSFKRKSSETIVTAMRRARVMAERVRHLWPTALWENGKRLEILTSILKQIIDIKTRKHLEYEEMKYLKTGTILEYKAILDIVETYETTNDLIPAQSNPLTINVCTGVPTISYQCEPQLRNDTIHPRTNANKGYGTGIYAGEPMETQQAYKPTFSFPPKSDQKLKENPIWKKAKTNRGNERATKSPSRDESRPIRKAVRPSDRSRSSSFSKDRQAQGLFTASHATPKKVTDKKDEKKYPENDRRSRSQSRDRYDYDKNHKNYIDNHYQYNRPKYYRGNDNQRYNRDYSRDRGNYRKNYSNSQYKPNHYRNDNQSYHNNDNNKYRKRSFSEWRDNGEQRQHTRNWNQRDKRDRTDMYQCKSCRTIHVLGSFCPTTGVHINETTRSTQPLN